MPLPTPLADLRHQLQNLLAEDLPAALIALKDLLPDGTDKYAQVFAFQSRLKDANQERRRNTISMDDYRRQLDTIRANCFDLIGELEATDLEVPAPIKNTASQTNKQGSVLYRVPHKMPIRKPSICLVRVAIDPDALLDDIVMDDEMRFRERVQVSDMMRADLLDPENEVFRIRPLSAQEQLVRDEGYTQWLFSVTPLVEGEHQLLVKVSMLEYIANLGQYVPREVSILETVTIVTEEAEAPADREEGTLKSKGERFVLNNAPISGPATKAIKAYPSSPGPNSPIMTEERPSTPPTAEPPNFDSTNPRSSNKGLRALAVFLAFLVVGSTATYLHEEDAASADRIRLEEAAAQRDTDGDGVTDKEDGCPDDKNKTAPGICGCRIPDLDSDGDGVADCNDQCPTEKGEAANRGCPSLTPGPSAELTAILANIRKNMVFVKGSTFTMGCQEGRDGNCSDNEKPAHQVTLSDFFIGKTEVTFAEYDAFCEATKREKPKDEGWGRGQHPVINVTWYDAVAYCNWLSEQQGLTAAYAIAGEKVTLQPSGKGYRLPTEAEWEYAARSGAKSKNYPYSGSKDFREVAWSNYNSGNKTHIVGSKKANELGLYDMSGNVYEWCADWDGDYVKATQTNPKGPNIGKSRVLRGGSWSYASQFCRVAHRMNGGPGVSDSQIGFRLVL